MTQSANSACTFFYISVSKITPNWPGSNLEKRGAEFLIHKKKCVMDIWLFFLNTLSTLQKPFYCHNKATPSLLPYRVNVIEPMEKKW